MSNSLKLSEDELLHLKAKLRSFREIGCKQVLRIIEQLQSASISYEQLHSTRISQTIKSLSLANFDNLADETEGTVVNVECSSLLASWKKLSVKPQPVEPQPSKLPLLPSKPWDKKVTNESYLEKEIPVYDDPSSKELLPRYSQTTRAQGVLAVYRCLTKVREEMSVKQTEWVSLAVELEKNIFNRSPQAVHYKTNIREVIGLLKSEEIIIDVVAKILQKDISCQDVAEGKSHAFLTQQRREEIRKTQERLLEIDDPQFYKNIRRMRLAKMEGERCRACKKKTAFLIKELQTRSADEPMTRFMECNSCGKSWRD